MVLAGPGEDAPEELADAFARPNPAAEDFVKIEIGLAERLLAEGFDKGERLTRALLADSVADLIPVLNEHIDARNVTAHELYDLGADGITEFLKNIPTRHVLFELRRARHAQRHHNWTANDLNDLAALTVAVVYCDVVVTENLWTDLLRRSKLDACYDTIVLSDLAELPAALVDLQRIRS